MSLRQKIKDISKKFISSDFKNRQHMIHVVTMFFNFIVAAGKILLALYLSSIFLFSSPIAISKFTVALKFNCLFAK